MKCQLSWGCSSILAFVCLNCVSMHLISALIPDHAALKPVLPEPCIVLVACFCFLPSEPLEFVFDLCVD
jgi:hypothetical protein